MGCPLDDTPLQTHDGKMVPSAEALKGKICVLFFSSEWCPACSSFIPTLATLYEEAQENDVPLAVVYVSSDRDSAQKDRYMQKKHGPWLSVPYDNVEARNLLKTTFGCFAGAEANQFPGVKRRAGIPSVRCRNSDHHCRIMTRSHRLTRRPSRVQQLVVMGPNGEEHVHMDCDPPTEFNRKGAGVLDEWSKFAWPA